MRGTTPAAHQSHSGCAFVCIISRASVCGECQLANWCILSTIYWIATQECCEPLPSWPMAQTATGEDPLACACAHT